MRFIKFNYILIIVSVIFLVILFWKFTSLLSFSNSNIHFEGDSQQEKLYPNHPLIQKITATENNLNQINLSLSKFSPKLGDKITLEILDETCHNVLAKSKLDIFSWKFPGYEKMRFKSLSDSKGKIYCLKINYLPKGKEQEKKAYISSYVSPDASYTNTGNKKNFGEQKNRTLELKPAYGNSSVWQNFSELIDRMSQYKADFLKGYSLIITFLLSIILIILITVIIILI